MEKNVKGALMLLAALIALGAALPGLSASASVTQQPYAPQPSQARDARIETISYDIAAAQYVLPSGQSTPYRIRGVLSLPVDGENLPLALILHGSHDNENPEARLYEGYTYLAEALARAGYAAAALDIQPAFVWKYGDNMEGEKIPAMVAAQLKSFQRAASGEALFPADLTGRIDADRLVLIGHSRGGDVALSMSTQLDEVIGVLAVAPASQGNEKPWRDVPLSMVVPALDGDVADYNTYQYWPSIRAARRNSLFVATMVHGANHNFFNAKLTIDDAPSLYTAEELRDRLSGQAQRDFLCGYAADFMDYAARGMASGTAFDLSNPAPSTLHRASVRNLYDAAGFVPLLDVTKAPQSAGLSAAPVVESNFFRDDTAPGFQFPVDRMNLLDVAWENRDNRLDIPAPSGLGAYAGISLNLVPDPSDARNPRGASQAMRVVFALEAGAELSVTIPGGVSAMDIAPGENTYTQIDGKTYAYWSRYTPPSTVRIPFATVDGLDPSAVRSISLRFDQSDSGAMMLEGVYGYP